MRFLCVFPPCVLPTAVLHASIIILCLSFLIFIADLFIRRVRKIAKSDYQLRHVCLSVRLAVPMEQSFSHWTDLHEIWNLSVFRNICGGS